MQNAGNQHRSPPIVCVITLGCDKNTVDSQRLLGLLVQAGFWIAERPEDSDLALVNTCAFIEQARRETQEVLGHLADLKRRTGRPRRVAAAGCLVERLGTLGTPLALPADARIGFADYPRIAEICHRLLEEADKDPSGAVGGSGIGPLPDEFHRVPRLLTGLPHVAALKIAEGCSNCCHYCAIPLIRGPQVSRPLEEIVAEAQQLEGSGVREILLIAQDTTSWGVDRYGERGLSRLLQALSAQTRSVRYRLLYAHPRHVTDELIATLAENPRFLPYLDLPLQHISDRVLASMGRGMTAADIRRLVERIRTRWPEVVLRTSYIVGYPNEESPDFEELVAWVREGHFVYAGVFAYSREPGTRAAELEDRVSLQEKERRREILLKEQREVTRRLLRDRLGTTLEVIVDQPAAPRPAPVPGVRGIGRALWQAPEVDGVVYVRGALGRRQPGDVIQGRVVQALDYDLVVEAPK